MLQLRRRLPTARDDLDHELLSWSKLTMDAPTRADWTTSPGTTIPPPALLSALTYDLVRVSLYAAAEMIASFRRRSEVQSKHINPLASFVGTGNALGFWTTGRGDFVPGYTCSHRQRHCRDVHLQRFFQACHSPQVLGILVFVAVTSYNLKSGCPTMEYDWQKPSFHHILSPPFMS
jgi:hypothetical protein